MAKQVKKKGANGYKLPDPLPKGEILTDLLKKKWKLGISIGQGGFGEIYSAQEAESKSTNYPYVIKIEPHENGPLFVEINFYIRNAKQQDVNEFKNKNKLKTFGMPIYLGSGSHEYKNQKYRFLVMHKFGTDIWKLFIENGKLFPTSTVFKLATQILDVLEYIHQQGYVHADIKGANILLNNDEDQIYLVDFGLATKYQTVGEFKPNPKKAHDGTIEYLSRDAHLGVPTRRGDLEILAYNIIQWLGCTLPWEKNLTNPTKVQELKEKSMSDPQKFLKTSFDEDKEIPKALPEFLKLINSLKHDEKPNYVKIKKLFDNEIPKNLKLTFAQKKTTTPKRKATSKKTQVKRVKKNEESQDDDEEMEEDSIVVDEKEKKKVTVKKDSKLNVNVENNFDGFTPEMKAIAMKSLNKDKKPKKTEKLPKVKEIEVNGTGRNRRNLKQINYTE